MQEFMLLCVDIAGIGAVLGGSMAFIVITADYVITSLFSMLKGR